VCIMHHASSSPRCCHDDDDDDDDSISIEGGSLVGTGPSRRMCFGVSTALALPTCVTRTPHACLPAGGGGDCGGGTNQEGTSIAVAALYQYVYILYVDDDKLYII